MFPCPESTAKQRFSQASSKQDSVAQIVVAVIAGKRLIEPLEVVLVTKAGYMLLGGHSGDAA